MKHIFSTFVFKGLFSYLKFCLYIKIYNSNNVEMWEKRWKLKAESWKPKEGELESEEGVKMLRKMEKGKNVMK